MLSALVCCSRQVELSGVDALRLLLLGQLGSFLRRLPEDPLLGLQPKVFPEVSLKQSGQSEEEEKLHLLLHFPSWPPAQQ